MCRNPVFVTALYFAIGASICQAAENDKPPEKGRSFGDKGAAIVPRAYFGIHVADIHPSIASHLPGISASGQGVIVEAVYADSPAATAGIHEHDILMTYGDQKLFGREQFVKLIATDQPGHDVAIGLIREGKQQAVTVRLGERPAHWTPIPAPHDPAFRNPFRMEFPQRFRHGPAASDVPRASWHRIESITIKRLENDRFRATLTHYDKDKKLEKHEYEGTRDELRKLIDADDDVKANERHHLFRSLDIPDRSNPWSLFPEEKESGF